MDDLAATLAVEATIHYLDATVDLADAEMPDPRALALVRMTLDDIAGAQLAQRAGWNDVSYALKGTGRAPLTEDDLAALGSDAQRLPLIQ